MISKKFTEILHKHYKLTSDFRMCGVIVPNTDEVNDIVIQHHDPKGW